jgi:hypothetical protein
MGKQATDLEEIFVISISDKLLDGEHGKI